MLTLPSALTTTTMVVSFCCCCCCFFGGGCGTSAAMPVGVVGVMAMKMMISTRRTSISGTTFGSDIELPCPPTEIPIANPPCAVRAGHKRSLSAGLHLSRNHADNSDAHAVHDVDGMSDIAKSRVVLALDEGDL